MDSVSEIRLILAGNASTFYMIDQGWRTEENSEHADVECFNFDLADGGVGMNE